MRLDNFLTMRDFVGGSPPKDIYSYYLVTQRTPQKGFLHLHMDVFYIRLYCTVQYLLVFIFFFYCTPT